MATRAARIPARDRRLQIMGVAMELFARQGYVGTTTRKISESARVNEAIIFRHFPRKEDLYWAIIEQKCKTMEARAELRQKLSAARSDREAFESIAEDILRRNMEDSTLARLLLFSALENHHLADRFFRTYVAERYEALSEHIRRRIRQGHFRKVDPLLAARGFLGMVIYHFLIQEIFGGKTYRQFDPRQVSVALTDIWLQGMLIRRDYRNSSRSGKKQTKS